MTYILQLISSPPPTRQRGLIRKQPHRALHNEDILREIFQWLSPMSDLPAKTLFRTATVCKLFSEHALDLLWRELDDLIPLLQLLSSSFVRVVLESSSTYLDFPNHLCRHVKHAFVLCGRIKDEEWLRFQYYARRIRRLIFHNTTDRIHPSVFYRLSRQASGKPLLPTLVSLHWFQYSPDTQIISFLSGSLTNLAITLGSYRNPFDEALSEEDEVFKDIFSALRAKSPFLRSFTFTGPVTSSLLVSETETMDLQSLHIHYPQIPLRALHRFANMDNLVTLAVNLPGMMHAETVTCDFPCLRTLEVAGELQTITRFLEAVSSPCLEELVTKVPTSTSAPVAENYRQCFEVLRTRFSASLESIVFQGTRNAWNADSPSLPAASKQILEPLLCIHQLKRLELTFPRTIPLELTNEDVQAMALSWPRVTVLDIYYPGPVSAVYPSVYSLVSFASHCPKLHTVSLPCLDTPAVPSLGLPAPPVCWHGLQELLIPNQLVSVTDADSVACFLDCLFPCLDVTSLGSEECLGDQWECVRRKMYYLQKSRSMMPVVG